MGRGFAHNFFIAVGKVRARIIAYANGDLRNRQVGRFQQFFRLHTTQLVEVSHNRHSVLFLKSVGEVVLIQVKMLGQHLQGDIFLVAGVQNRLNSTGQVGVGCTVEGDGNQLRMP